MFRKLLVVVFALASATLTQAQVVLNADHPDAYVVKSGDTLWDISALFLRDPWLWPSIWQINPQIENPHLIYPGDVVRLIYVDGQPRLVMDSSGASRPAGASGLVRLTPQMTSIPREQAIASIPISQIREFFTGTRVLTEEQAEAAPYMVAGPERRIMVGQNDPLYARGTLTPGITLYQIYRVGDPYRDPGSRQVLGLRAQLMGTARFESQSPDVSRFAVLESTQEIMPGDILLPLEQDNLDAVLYPRAPDVPVSAQIIGVEGGISHIGQLNVVALNRGAAAGIANGMVLGVMESGERVRDRIGGGSVQLPDERAGLLIVFKTLPNLSFGLILEAEKPLAVGSPVVNP